MNRESIISFWKDDLNKFTRSELRDLGLNSENENFLTDVGLPIHNSHYPELYCYGNYNYDGSLIKTSYYNIAFVQFAAHDYMKQCLCISTLDNCIYRVNSEEKQSLRYVNKNIETYMLSWTIMLTLREQYPLLNCDYENEEADRQQFLYVRDVYESIKSIDEKAVAYSSYWLTTGLYDFAMNECSNHWNEVTALVESGKCKDFDEAMYAFISGKETFLKK